MFNLHYRQSKSRKMKTQCYLIQQACTSLQSLLCISSRTGFKNDTPLSTYEHPREERSILNTGVRLASRDLLDAVRPLVWLAFIDTTLGRYYQSLTAYITKLWIRRSSRTPTEKEQSIIDL
jgi:hypothetical protein